MSVTETLRIELLEAAQRTLGRDAAITLMEMLPPSGWGDVATRQRVDSLECDIGLRFRAGIAEMQASTTRWAVGTVVAVVGVGSRAHGRVSSDQSSGVTPRKSATRSRVSSSRTSSRSSISWAITAPSSPAALRSDPS